MCARRLDRHALSAPLRQADPAEAAAAMCGAHAQLLSAAELSIGLRIDPYVVGCHPRSLLFPGRAATRALSPSGQAGNFPVLLIDGVVAGVWHQRRSGRKLHFTAEPFDQLTAAQRSALDEQVERIATFLAGTPELTIGTVTVGPHA